jgi:hypothetical protein
VVTLALKGKQVAYYLLRGWFVGPEITIARLNGPWCTIKDITPSIRESSYAGNLDRLWVRKTR